MSRICWDFTLSFLARPERFELPTTWFEDVAEPFDAMRFDYSFIGSAEGLLSVYVDNAQVRKIDDRRVANSAGTEIASYVGNIRPGQHVIAFRLDAFSETPSSVAITNVELGSYKGALVPRDSDGDGVPDLDDNCPAIANPDQADAESDGVGDVCDPDDDNDNVLDGVDLCPSTEIPESGPTRRLGNNKWTLEGGPDGFSFSQAGSQSGSVHQFTTTDTGGCSCEQIVTATGAGKGHLRNGCSTSLMLNWVGSL